MTKSKGNDVMPVNQNARAWAPILALAAGLAIAGAACVSPDIFYRDGGDPAGAGGAPGPGAGGSTVNGSGGSNGAGGNNTGAGGVTGAGGRTGTGGATGGGGAVVIGPTANYMDDFETGDVTQRWIAPQSSDSTPCGTWSVAPEATGSTNHVYSQTSTACTSSNPSWAAGGNTAWMDMRLQVRVKFAAGASTSTKITIAVRYNDPKDMYFIEYTNDGKMKIREKTTSSTTDIMSTTSKMAIPVPDGTWSTIGLSIKGTTINAYLGTDPTAPALLTGTASGQASGGVAIGVADGTASFDDVLVTPP